MLLGWLICRSVLHFSSHCNVTTNCLPNRTCNFKVAVTVSFAKLFYLFVYYTVFRQFIRNPLYSYVDRYRCEYILKVLVYMLTGTVFHTRAHPQTPVSARQYHPSSARKVLHSSSCQTVLTTAISQKNHCRENSTVKEYYQVFVEGHCIVQVRVSN